MECVHRASWVASCCPRRQTFFVFGLFRFFVSIRSFFFVFAPQLMLTAKQTVLEEFRAAYTSNHWDEALRAIGSEFFASPAFSISSEHHFVFRAAWAIQFWSS